MKVLLTGATGYIGHQLAMKLANLNYEVNALVRDLDSKKIPQHKNIKPVKGNICDYESRTLSPPSGWLHVTVDGSVEGAQLCLGER